MTPREQEQHDQFLRQFLQNEEALRGFVRSLVPSRQDALEVMQEVAAVLWRKFDQLESADDFRRWAFGVARLEALAFHRDRARDRHTFDEDLLLLLASESEASHDLQVAQREALEGCLKKLPESQRALVAAVYQQNTKVEQVASLLGKTPMAIYKLLHRVRMSLLECITRTLTQEGFA